MQVRKASIDDINEIAALYIEQFSAMKDLQPAFFQEGEQSKVFIQGMIEGDDSDILVLHKNNNIIGFILLQVKETPDFPFFIKHRYAYLMDIVISKSERGQGMGSTLIKEAKQWAKDRNLAYIELDVLSNNDKAITFYKKHSLENKRQSMFCRL